MQVSFAKCTPYDLNNIIEITQWSLSFHLFASTFVEIYHSKNTQYYIMIIALGMKSQNVLIWLFYCCMIVLVAVITGQQ